MIKRCKKCFSIYDASEKFCPNCKGEEYSITNENGRGNKSNKKSNAMSTIAIAVIILIIFGLISSCHNHNYTDEDLENAAKWNSCEKRSSTYYKCSWSFWEDRCVCKQR